jgi:hypothetical protein
VTIPAGVSGTSFPIQTSPVTATTVATITASSGGVVTRWKITLTSEPAPTGFFVRPISTTNGSQGVVTTAEGVGHDQVVRVTSSNPALAAVPDTVTVTAVSGIGFFDITTTPVTAPTTVTISVSGGDVTLSKPLTLYPTLPAFTSLTVNPTAVAGGTASVGTVTLAGPAPAVGVEINVQSNLPLTASVPDSVIVPGGATSASFTVTTFPVASTTTVQLSAAMDNVFQFAAINVTPAAQAPSLSSVSVSPASVGGGASSRGTVTLSAAAPSGGTVVTLSDNSSVTTVPASVTVPAGSTSATFTITTTSVTASTTATISAAFNGVTRTSSLTVNPVVPGAPSLVAPANGATAAQPVTLDWNNVSNAASYEVQVDDTSTISAPFVANPTVTASQVTLGNLPAQQLWWRVRARNAAGVFGAFSATRQFTPQGPPAPASLSAVTMNPSSAVGGNGSTGTVTLTAAAPAGGAVVTLSSSNTTVASVPPSVTIAAGTTNATFAATTSSVATSTTVTITALYSGVSRTTPLTVTPVPPPASLQSVSMNPASVPGGSNSTGTVTLSSAAPAGGSVVSLSSSNAAATVPASVVVAAGTTNATFAAATSAVATSTAVTISASYGGVTQSAALTVTPSSQPATLTVTASGRSGESVTSSPPGINVSVGATRSASFGTGTSITLTVSNGRSAIWSGACASGGSKTKTCTFTIAGSASVTANVQ